MPSRRLSRGRSHKGKGRYEWVGGTQTAPVVVAVGGLSAAVLLAPATLEEWPGGLISRILMNGFISPSTAPAGASGYGCYFGLSKCEVASGVTTTYDPETELDHRWSYWSCAFPQIGGTGAADANASRWIGYVPFMIDYKPNMRIGADMNLTFLVKNSPGSAAGIQYSFAYRVLVRAGAK